MQLASDETALVKLTYRLENDSVQQPFHESSFIKTQSLDPTIINPSLELLAKADFTYEVDITIIKGNDVLGGYKANWTAAWNDLDDDPTIIFHTLTQQKADETQRAIFITNLPQTSIAAPQPEIIS